MENFLIFSVKHIQCQKFVSIGEGGALLANKPITIIQINGLS